ncbi:MAG: hypothetical protein BAA04_11580 [Firmicutes bacterium ZCTH02-B6]|nr:MAG: hypothetical protein BAA04_11580 [Firmicutes bacterium ZCTH02-B6]
MFQPHGQLTGETGATGHDTCAPSSPAVAHVLNQFLNEQGESVARALTTLSRMEQEGTLEELAGALTLLKLLKDALTDDMVIGLARRVERLAAVAADPAVSSLLERLPGALRAAESGTVSQEGAPGLTALWRQLGDPQVRRGLAYLLAVVKRLAPEAP